MSGERTCKNCGSYSDSSYSCSPRCAGILDRDDGCVICHSWDGYSFVRRRCKKCMHKEDQEQLVGYQARGDKRMVRHMRRVMAERYDV